METNMISLETNYLVNAGYSEYAASYFLEMEEQLVSNNSDKI